MWTHILNFFRWTTLERLRKSFSIEDCTTLSPKTMHHVYRFRWRWHVLSWMVVVWSEFVSLVSCILPPLHRFRTATYGRQLQTRHTGRWLTFVKFRCKVVVHWFNRLFWPIRISRILQPRRWLEICKCQWTITVHQCSSNGFAGNELAFVHVLISILSGNSVPYFEKYGCTSTLLADFRTNAVKYGWVGRSVSETILLNP